MGGETIALLVVLGGLFLLMFFSTRKQRRMQQEHLEKINELKVGDKVRTHVGIYATIKNIYESTDGKIAVLEIGEGDKSVCFEMEFRLIYGLDTKTEVKFDEGTPLNSIDSAEVLKAKEEIKEKIEEAELKATFDEENDTNV